MKKLLKNELAKFLIVFFVLYIMVFIVLNLTGWLIRPRPSGERFSAKETFFSQNFKQESECTFSEKTNSILVPKIGIEAPLIFPNESDTDFTDDLNRGVVHYPGSGLPGKQGETIFLGHSAPLGWPKLPYNWIFSDLKKLEPQDEIYIFFQNCEYKYEVMSKYFVDKGQELPALSLESESVLTLISCWPPGRAFQRIVVRAELVK